MDKDLVLFYLKKIEEKIKICMLNTNETLRNDLLMYLELCIEVCNLIKKRFYKDVSVYKNIFDEIQAEVLLKDFNKAFNIISSKKKELGYSGKVASS